MFSGRSLQSVATLLIYACQRIGRANGLDYLFALERFHFPGAGGGVFWQISTIGGGAFGICMPACREGERSERFVFCACDVPFSLTAGQCFRAISTIGAGAFGVLCMSAGRESIAALLVYACQRVRRASGLKFFFALTPLKFPGPGGGIYDGSLLSPEALLVCSCQQVGKANG